MKTSKRNQRLYKAGLLRSAMADKCAMRHAHYMQTNGFAYCPWCGLELVIKHRCEHCGHVFTSDEAFRVHQDNLSLYKSNPCPNYSQGERHNVRWLKNRRRFYCPQCDLEYTARVSEQ